MSRIGAAIGIICTAVLLFCFSNFASAEPLAGKGTWRSLSGDVIKGTWTAALERHGDHVEGTLSLTGSNVLSGGTVTGDIDASSIMLGVAAAGSRQATFSGKLDGNAVKGEWNLDCDLVKDHGVWTGAFTKGKPDSSAAE